jgi:diacylglycerol kinase (ATP)
MSKICLTVLNPGSGNSTLEKDSLLDRIERLLIGYQIISHETTGKDDLAVLKAAIEKLQPLIVLVGGGDGTVRLVASALIHRPVVMGIIPLGSANGLAKCLGINNIDDSWQALSDQMARKLDVIQINEEISLHLADFGFNANLIRNFEEQETRGMLGYVKSSITEIFSTQPKQFRLTMDGTSTDLTCKMLVIANGDKYGTGATVNSTGNMEDGRFEVIAINPNGLDELIQLSFSFFNNSLHEMEYVQVFSCTSCSIQNHEGADFQIDGDHMEIPAHVEANILHQALNIFVGPHYPLTE